MRLKLKKAWKERNNIAMGFLMIFTVYAAFVARNLKSNQTRKKDEFI
jgi:hypothetical protein